MSTEVASAPPALPFYDRWGLELINDPRDLPFLHLITGCALMATCGVGLFFAGEWFWYAAPVYLVAWGLVFLDRFILMLHCTSHRILFKRQFRALNYVIPWLVGPFFGETPESYFAHHMGMHHPENNLADDDSTTIIYRRSSALHWLHYYLTFMAFGLPKLARYHVQKGNQAMVRRLVIGELTFWASIAALGFADWRATAIVFVIPVVFVRLLMMAGNWGQHAFVDASDPGNAYKNSITCINTRYNRRCFNDGYHIHHHVKPRCHFTELPKEFEDNRETYGKEDAIVFDGIDFFQVWLYLMVGRWNALAERFVQLPGAPARSKDEVIALLKSRVEPIPTA